MTRFKDHFSSHAAEYAEFRPHYPEALFAYLASLAPSRAAAWDCATGNGQAAVALAAHFAEVIATDASAAQIESAQKHDHVEYRVAPAERSDLDPDAVDLVTVAQALHWFDIPAFFEEVKRVLRRDGVIAVWTYNLLTLSSDIDPVVDDFYRETVGQFWPPERGIVEAGYRTVEFPFEEIAAPEFAMEARWNLPELLGYLRTWSATQKFTAVRGYDPVDSLGDELRTFWKKANERRVVRWPLSVRVGKVCS